MQKLVQPQTKINSKDRDAAAQIRDKAKQIVRDQVRERIITMRAGYINRATDEKNKASGILILAKELGLINGQTFLDGLQWAKAELAARSMKNDRNSFEKYDNEAIDACWQFDRHFQE